MPWLPTRLIHAIAFTSQAATSWNDASLHTNGEVEGNTDDRYYLCG
ncbi:hypothetical protein [Stenomitos frigidus]|nr:hypothetical protein [Stenomitos frigidus]